MQILVMRLSVIYSAGGLYACIHAISVYGEVINAQTNYFY